MRIYLANVGSNSSHGAFSPIFDDGAFEFVPIPVRMDRDEGLWPGAVLYRDLRSHHDPGRDLLQYVSPNLHDWPCHNDPEFATFTYGDYPDNGRAAGLTNLERGDALLFLARLEGWAGGQRTGHAGFYLIGGLAVEYAGYVHRHSPQWLRFANNDHAVRGDLEFWGVGGSGRSRRFARAVPVNRELCEQVFRDRNGRPWNWGWGASDLATIGSYTRSIRCTMDTGDAAQRRRAGVLRDWIARHTGNYDAELLAAVP